MAAASVALKTRIWHMIAFGTSIGKSLLLSMLEKLKLYHLMDLINQLTMLLLLWKWFGLSSIKTRLLNAVILFFF